MKFTILSVTPLICRTLSTFGWKHFFPLQCYEVTVQQAGSLFCSLGYRRVNQNGGSASFRNWVELRCVSAGLHSFTPYKGYTIYSSHCKNLISYRLNELFLNATWNEESYICSSAVKMKCYHFHFMCQMWILFVLLQVRPGISRGHSHRNKHTLLW
jgi:hypothetical protein